jgi:hypothetical protein
MKIYLDGNTVRKIEDLPPKLIPYVREKIKYSGALALVMNIAAFSPVLSLYTTSGGTSTETVPVGANNLEVQAWGPGAGGNKTFVAGTTGGGGGGGGAYSRCTLAVSAQVGNTFIVVVGTGGGTATGVSVFAGTTQIAAGSVTGFNTVTCRGAVSGLNQNGGAGGTATNANSGATNSNGTNGGNASGVTGGTGGAGIAGDVSGDGSPYGAGGHGQLGGAPDKGHDGAAAFYYT